MNDPKPIDPAIAAAASALGRAARGIPKRFSADELRKKTERLAAGRAKLAQMRAARKDSDA